MLKKWSVENFKSFRDRTDLELASINVFAGANNSGKSTIIQSILSLKQTLQYAPTNRPIALNGPLVKLGTFDDVKNQAGKTDYIGLSWVLEFDDSYDPSRFSPGSEFGAYPPFFWEDVQIQQAEYEVRFDVDEAQQDLAFAGRAGLTEIAQLQPNLAYTSIRVTLNADSEDGQQTQGDRPQAHIVLSRVVRPPADDTAAVDRKRPIDNVSTFDVSDVDNRTKGHLFQRWPDAKIAGANTRHFFPLSVLILYDKAKEKARLLSEAICSGSPISMARRRQYMDEILPNEVVSVIEERLSQTGQGTIFSQITPLTEPNRRVTLRAILEATRRVRPPLLRAASTPPPSLADLQPKIEEIFLHEFESELAIDVAYPDEIYPAVEFARYFFTSAVRYLGPLRDEPKLSR
jgi:hypothetical protein